MKNKLETLEELYLNIAEIPGSPNKVCGIAIAYYKNYLNHQDPYIRQIAQAMVGNLTEYYELTTKDNNKFKGMLDHLSEMASFIDGQNTSTTDIEASARIKSFYSFYEKIIETCFEHIEHELPIPNTGLINDIFATRNVFYPRYHLRHEPQEFFKCTYGHILSFMEKINELSKQDSRYGFVEIPEITQINVQKPIIHSIDPKDYDPDIPDITFLEFAFQHKNIPDVYKTLANLPDNVDIEDLKKDILTFQKSTSDEELEQTELMKFLRNTIRKQTLINFRHKLESELILSIADQPKMYHDYKESVDDFLYIYHFRLKPYQKDYASIIKKIDNAIATGKPIENIGALITGEEKTKDQLLKKFHEASLEQEAILLDHTSQIRNLDLNRFDEDFENARNVIRYSKSIKDFMTNPKANFYQALHLIVKTPYGNYEVQFKTEEQNRHAEFGLASHSQVYKTHEKNDFHRLKVCTPLVAKKDENNDIVYPIQLEPLPLDKAIKSFYHQDFKFYSGGMTFDEFRKKYPNEKEFDAQMLALSDDTQISSLNPSKKDPLWERLTKGLRKKAKAKRLPPMISSGEDR